MPNALFVDISRIELIPPASDPGHRMDTVLDGTATLRINPEVVDQNPDAVKAILRSLARLQDKDLIPLQDALAKIADDEDAAAWASIDQILGTDNLALRDRYVASAAPLTIADLAGQLGHEPDAVSRLAARWTKHGEILSADHRGTTYYPAFQFRNGRPHPTIRLALAALPADMTQWQKIFWFISANGWLSGDAPEEKLDDPNLVMEVARHESEMLVG